ncbi:4'-phosphopantetheinyl transferase [Gammaproteobacteria bacterium]
MTLTVWRIALNNETWAIRLWPLLDISEKTRAERFRGVDLRRRHVIAHGAVRLLLADFCQQPVTTLRLVQNAWGKPALADAGSPVFNLSHTQDLALCAIAPAGEIGVDIEALRPSPIVERLDLARRFFSLDEYQALNELDTQAFSSAFFRCWTRKEAYIKAKGLGLSLPLNQFSVACRLDAAPALLASEYCPADVTRYQFWDLAVPEGYCGSLAYCGPAGDKLICRDWALDSD